MRPRIRLADGEWGVAGEGCDRRGTNRRRDSSFVTRQPETWDKSDSLLNSGTDLSPNPEPSDARHRLLWSFHGQSFDTLEILFVVCKGRVQPKTESPASHQGIGKFYILFLVQL